MEIKESVKKSMWQDILSTTNFRQEDKMHYCMASKYTTDNNIRFDVTEYVCFGRMKLWGGELLCASLLTKNHASMDYYCVKYHRNTLGGKRCVYKEQVWKQIISSEDYKILNVLPYKGKLLGTDKTGAKWYRHDINIDEKWQAVQLALFTIRGIASFTPEEAKQCFNLSSIDDKIIMANMAYIRNSSRTFSGVADGWCLGNNPFESLRVLKKCFAGEKNPAIDLYGLCPPMRQPLFQIWKNKEKSMAKFANFTLGRYCNDWIEYELNEERINRAIANRGDNNYNRGWKKSSCPPRGVVILSNGQEWNMRF